jgi:hypothetical protein
MSRSCNASPELHEPCEVRGSDRFADLRAQVADRVAAGGQLLGLVGHEVAGIEYVVHGGRPRLSL